MKQLDYKFWFVIITFLLTAYGMHTDMGTKLEVQAVEIKYIQEDINDIKKHMGLTPRDRDLKSERTAFRN